MIKLKTLFFYYRTLKSWKDLASQVEKNTKDIHISLVGKYTKLEDSYASISKSLQHATIAVGVKLNLKFIEACHLEEQTRDENPTLYYEAWKNLTSSQ